MGCNKIGDHVESNPPPNSAKDVARQVLHAAEEANEVVDLGEVLEEEHYQQHCHHSSCFPSLQLRWNCNPQHHLPSHCFSIVYQQV